MKRIFISLALSLLTVGLLTNCSDRQKTTASRFCQPNESCWPKEQDWAKLNDDVNGRLIELKSFMAPCLADANSDACQKLLTDAKNPFFLQDQPNATQISGMFNGWNSESSKYAVAAESTDDIVAAVNFAREHRLKLVIKGAGHSYFGRSSAPNSLLVWTHKMRDIAINDKFIPQGCTDTSKTDTAVTAGAGTRWLETYQAVTSTHGRYVQGGNCASVGTAGGFMQGGGFGPFSKKYGLAAASLLEAEVVTADGKVVVANRCQNSDLLWALRGGGGGTFGVVTKVTLKTHDLPKYFGSVKGKVTAKDDPSYLKLLEFFVNFYREQLNNDHWGEIIAIGPNNTLEIGLYFQDLNQEQADKVWSDFKAWTDKEPDTYTMDYKVIAVPAKQEWDTDYLEKVMPNRITKDARPEQTEPMFWWNAHQEQVGLYLYAYASRWIPADLVKKDNAKQFAETLFDASRNWRIELNINKGLSGGSEAAVAAQPDTSINPSAFSSTMLAILGAGQINTFPGVKGHDVNEKDAKEQIHKVELAMNILRKATPGAGAYWNEADYHEPNWQESFWGSNYPKLLSIKKKYDPTNLFTCHHCVGSEDNK